MVKLKHIFDINKIYLPEWVRLDQSENPYGFLYNRYPSISHEKKLYQSYVEYMKRDIGICCNLLPNNLLFTRGAADAIDLVLRTFALGDDDKILVTDPTFFPIIHWAKSYGISLCVEKLTGGDLSGINVDSVIKSKANLCFIINPNNPTSTCINSELLLELIEKFDGLVVVDEAYIDFCHNKSVVNLVHKHTNLIVLRTMSKSWGCAGLRAGFVIADSKLITSLQLIQPPFMCDSFTCDHATFIINERFDEFSQYRELIISSRNRLLMLLDGTHDFDILPSDTNFIMIKSKKTNKLENILMSNNFVTKLTKIHGVDYVRIGVGTQLEMKLIGDLLVSEASCDSK